MADKVQILSYLYDVLLIEERRLFFSNSISNNKKNIEKYYYEISKIENQQKNNTNSIMSTNNTKFEKEEPKPGDAKEDLKPQYKEQLALQILLIYYDYLVQMLYKHIQGSYNIKLFE